MNSATPAEPVLSLVIPAYNYADQIDLNVRLIQELLTQYPESFELILVNDGSSDETPQRIQKLATDFSTIRVISYPNNRGKGFAVKQGVEAAKGKYVFFTDVDLPYGLDPILIGIEILNRDSVDIILGSRDLAESHDILSYDLKRKIAKKGFNMIVNWFLRLGIKDTQCGLKGFRREVALDIFSQVSREDFSFDVEVLFLAKRKKYRIQFVPVHLKHSAVSTVSVIRDSFKMFGSVLVITCNHWRGKYDVNNLNERVR